MTVDEESVSQNIVSGEAAGLTLEAYTLKLHEMGVIDSGAPLDRTQTLGAGHSGAPHGTQSGFRPGLKLRQAALRRVYRTKDPQESSPELRMMGTLGEGGMGLVQLARQIALERDVAVKTVRASEKNTDASSLLLLEALITGMLEHPNIVPIYTLGKGEDEDPLIVMKRIEGRSLRAIIDAPSRTHPVEYRDALEWYIQILTQVCNALHFAHSRGIIHRDIKSDNVMIGEFGEVYVLDWGIAVSLREEHAQRFPMARDVKTPAGTPHYMAPEMAAGRGDQLGEHTDVYLVGAMLHELITGKPPHEGDTLKQILFAAYRGNVPSYDDSVPEGLARICTKAMAADPSERFSGVDALRAALAEFLLHRESTELTFQATKRARHLEAIVLGKAKTDKEGLEAHRTYVEGRFGFEQALRVWAGNERARLGRRRIIEAMVEFELGRLNHQAASTLVAELDAPPAKLVRRLEEMASASALREKEFASLRQEHFDNDIDVGVGRRSILFAVLAASMVGPLIPRFVPGLEFLTFELTTLTYLVLLIPYGVLMGVGTFLGRRTFLRHSANRHALGAVYLVFGAAALHRVHAWHTDVSVHHAFGNELLFYVLGIGLISLMLDRRILGGALSFLVGYFVLLWRPEWAFEVYGIAGAVGLLLVAVLSRVLPARL